MSKKISVQLAEELLHVGESIIDKKINRAQYDKSYNATILGINQDFTDDVTLSEQKELIDKHSIPEVPDKDNYYTFKINGNYYVKSSNTSFNLYENVKIRIPNGNWDNMYIEVQKDTVSSGGSAKTNWFVNVSEPIEHMSVGDYWIKINDVDHIEEIYQYYDNQWNFLCKCNYTEGRGITITPFDEIELNQAGFVHPETTPDWYPNWAQEVAKNLGGVAIYGDCGFTTTNGYLTTAGRIKGDHNEIFNDYSDNSLVSMEGGYNFKTGRDTYISGNTCAVFNGYNRAGGKYNSVFGYKNGISSPASYCMVCGKNASVGDSDYRFVVGGMDNAADDANDAKYNNCFTISYNGIVNTIGSFHSSGADYSEYYEWEDGNKNLEDRRGLFVTIENNKIKPATIEADYILGVISAKPSIVGNSANEEWCKKYVKDAFGEKVVDENGCTIISELFNDALEYIPRSKRPEYSPVGTHGQLIVIDDGTCKVNGYCGVGQNGIGTKCEDMEKVYRGLAFRVTERIDETHVRIIIK